MEHETEPKRNKDLERQYPLYPKLFGTALLLLDSNSFMNGFKIILFLFLFLYSQCPSHVKGSLGVTCDYKIMSSSLENSLCKVRLYTIDPGPFPKPCEQRESQYTRLTLTQVSKPASAHSTNPKDNSTSHKQQISYNCPQD